MFNIDKYIFHFHGVTQKAMKGQIWTDVLVSQLVYQAFQSTLERWEHRSQEEAQFLVHIQT